MMFSELASIRIDGAKQAALLLHSLAPADRAWVLSKLDADQHGELAPLIAELNSMGLSSSVTAMEREAIGQALDGAGSAPDMELALPAANRGSSDRASWTDLEFLKSLNAEEVALLARTWSVEQPELVAYALKLQPWPWQEKLLEHLPVAQRGRVQAAVEAMASVAAETKLATAVMVRMRKYCGSQGNDTPVPSSAARVRASADGAANVAQPLQKLFQGWKRWASGLRREAP
ncbi:MAG TPA: hypothetical protein VGO04_09535 [Ensifer sp.]|jgi:hypothetical protein|uniref:hypothetical protein n=1 Tax=Ensifer sp. TaxID=1872086 RepID=UPI002E1364E8|nr:hypothetical protein [Ensifer sp.]